MVVSAGGGLYGGELLRSAVEAHRLELAVAGIDLRLIAGPFLPEAEWRALRDAVRRRRAGSSCAAPSPTSWPSCARPRARSASAATTRCSTSCARGVPALVVPFAAGREDEQTRRAVRLACLGAVRFLEAGRADGATLAAEIRALVDFRPTPLPLDTDGARVTAQIVTNALARRGPRRAPGRPDRELAAVSA